MDLDSSVCRICLLSDAKCFSLQHKTDINQEYTFLEMFNSCTRLEALELDDFPQFICQSCANDLQIAFDFLNRATASDLFLKNQHEVKNEEEYYYLSDENNMSQEENLFDLEERPITQDEVDVTLDQYEDNMAPETWEPVECEAINPENADRTPGFDKQFEQFVEEELASESVYMHESNGDSNQASEAGIIESDIDTEIEQKGSRPIGTQKNSGRKTSRESKMEDLFVECKICGKILRKMSIKHHLKRCQKEEKLHLCSSCPKSFTVRCDLKNHMRTHDKERERRYICSECGKGFFEKQSLKVHMIRHMGDKEYHCTICPKQFTTKKSLDVHEFTHNRQLGRFICKHCDKRFPSKADLTVHERFHTGDYPFQCEYCEKSYAVKSHYNYHLAKHKGITYKCDECDKEFMNRGSLTAHKFKHNERMPHECSICKKGFASPYKLNRHKSCHKPKEDEGRIK